MPIKVLYFDLETTGLDYKEHDIVQLAIIAEVDGKVVGQYEFKMQPKRTDNISPEALKANGFTIEELQKFPPAEDVFPKILLALDTHINKFDTKDKAYGCGYNIRFDISFLVEFFRRMDNPYLGSYIKWRDIDMLYLMYVYDLLGFHRLSNYKLGTVAKFYGMKHVEHDALSDTMIVRELFHKFLFPFINWENHKKFDGEDKEQ